MLSSNAAVLTPATIEEALLFRAQYPDAMPIAGGTDLMVFLELGAINPERFIDLWGVRELDTITETADGGRNWCWSLIARLQWMTAVPYSV